MCKVNSFCCGCTLKSGAITAAVMTAVIGILYLVLGIIALQGAAYIEKHYHRTEEVKAAITFAKVYGGIYLGCAIISILILVCIILAIVKESAGFLFPYLIFSMIQIVFATISSILGLAKGNFVILISVAIIAFQIYLWIVVLNYYRQLKDGHISPGKA